MTKTARMIVIGVVAPLVIGAAGIIAILVAIPRLPLPVATHWGVSGAPDGFGTPVAGMVLLAVVVIGYSAFAFAMARPADGSSTVNQRIILAIAPFFATLLTVIIAGSTVIQTGLRDARDAPSIIPVVAWAFGLGIALGVLAWFLLPASSSAPAPDPAALPTVALGATERAAWLQSIEPTRTVGATLISLMALALVGGGASFALVAPTWAFAVWLGGMLLVAVLVVGTLFWKVSIDASGLRVRSALGWPRFAIPADQVAAAAVITVNPARDFGGWGIRWGGAKRIGIVTRAGEALEVTRKDGRVLVVTVPHPTSGAGLLNALALRA
ncbi:hypothetical protein BH11ACT4_BH11ACT4_10710 [soil metagenome]